MSEAELQKAVIDCARVFKWRVAHFRPAQTARGWRTPVQADGAGFPDLVLARNGRLIFVELKTATGKLSVEQAAWIRSLEGAAEVYVWRPEQWRDGTIEKVLR